MKEIKEKEKEQDYILLACSKFLNLFLMNMESARTSSSSSPKGRGVNFSAPRNFFVKFRSKCKETFFSDDPFKPISQEPNGLMKTKKLVEYFVPIFEWLPRYNLQKLRYDVLAGITITSLAVPQGISYAKLANIPPIIGLCEFPFIYFYHA